MRSFLHRVERSVELANSLIEWRFQLSLDVGLKKGDHSGASARYLLVQLDTVLSSRVMSCSVTYLLISMTLQMVQKAHLHGLDYLYIEKKREIESILRKQLSSLA